MPRHWEGVISWCSLNQWIAWNISNMYHTVPALLSQQNERKQIIRQNIPVTWPKYWSMYTGTRVSRAQSHKQYGFISYSGGALGFCWPYKKSHKRYLYSSQARSTQRLRWEMPFWVILTKIAPCYPCPQAPKRCFTSKISLKYHWLSLFYPCIIPLLSLFPLSMFRQFLPSRSIGENHSCLIPYNLAKVGLELKQNYANGTNRRSWRSQIRQSLNGSTAVFVQVQESPQ